MQNIVYIIKNNSGKGLNAFRYDHEVNVKCFLISVLKLR